MPLSSNPAGCASAFGTSTGQNSDGLCDSSWIPEVHDSARGAANLNDVRLLTFRVRLLFLPLCSDSLIIFRTYFFGPFFLSRKILAASILAQSSSSNQQSLNSAAAPSSSSWELVVNLLLVQFTEFNFCSSRNLTAPVFISLLKRKLARSSAFSSNPNF